METKKAESMARNIVRERNKKVEPSVHDTLMSAFIADLPVHDFSYIDRRAREILEDMFKKIDFNSPEVLKAKKEFMLACFDQLMDARPEPRKFKKIPIDSTEERDKRCEPFVFEIINRVLDREMIFSEEDYFKEATSEMNGTMLKLLVMGFIDSFFNVADMSLEITIKQANNFLWEGKDPESRTMRQIDRFVKEWTEQEKSKKSAT